MARILVIDDNETMREGIAFTVKRMGHEVAMAASGKEGLAQWRGLQGLGGSHGRAVSIGAQPGDGTPADNGADIVLKSPRHVRASTSRVPHTAVSRCSGAGSPPQSHPREQPS